jgi:hypothetical protein
MSDTATIIIDSYLAAYGEPDPAQRRHLVEQSWSPTGTLCDPPMEATGHHGIDAMFAAVKDQLVHVVGLFGPLAPVEA